MKCSDRNQSSEGWSLPSSGAATQTQSSRSHRKCSKAPASASTSRPAPCPPSVRAAVLYLPHQVTRTSINTTKPHQRIPLDPAPKQKSESATRSSSKDEHSTVLIDLHRLLAHRPPNSNASIAHKLKRSHSKTKLKHGESSSPPSSPPDRPPNAELHCACNYSPCNAMQSMNCNNLLSPQRHLSLLRKYMIQCTPRLISMQHFYITGIIPVWYPDDTGTILFMVPALTWRSYCLCCFHVL